MNETHDPWLKSWIESANDPASDFPIQNLPFGVFRTSGPPRIGVAIGDQVLDLSESIQAPHTLQELLTQGHQAWSALRLRMSRLLRSDASASEKEKTRKHLLPMSSVEMLVPEIGDYSDFYASIQHATNVGRMMRPDNPLLPNYKYVPIGYHGRASSIVPSGAPVRRPRGQKKPEGTTEPVFGPTQLLDYELEVGFYIGPGNSLGASIPIDQAEAHLFGVCLLNDWSARDIQAWEYQPLGPFLSKSFATTVSPWIVTMEALEPYRVPALARPAGDPAPLPYLRSAEDSQRGAIAVTLQAFLSSEKMRTAKMAPVEICRSRLRDLYWTPCQLVAHHTSNGCNLRPGDLLGSGTVSGDAKESLGCLLERTRRGAEPIALPTGEMRRFLEDGDEVILRGFAERTARARIGLGECRGIVQPA